MIKLVQAPELCNIDLTFDYLIQHYKNHIRPAIDDKIQRDISKFSGMHTDIEQFGNNRNTGFLTQFTAVYGRNVQYLLRNPRSLSAILFNGMFTALLVLALFWHVGVYNENELMTDPAIRGRFVGNLLGLGFMMTNNICFSSSSGVIIQMPLQVPVFKREKANKMYTNSAYYFGRFWSNTIL